MYMLNIFEIRVIEYKDNKQHRSNLLTLQVKWKLKKEYRIGIKILLQYEWDFMT